MTVLALSYVILFLITTVALVLAADRFFKRTTNYKSFVTYLITVPVGIIHPHTKKTSETDLTKTLYTRLASLQTPLIIEIAVEPIGEDIHCYVSLPAWQKDTALAMIEQLYPSATLTRVDHELLHPSNLLSNVSYITQIKPYSVPLREHHTPSTDPHTLLLHYASRLASIGEGVTFQWLLVPARQELTKETRAVFRELDRGNYQPSKHIHEEVIVTRETLPWLKTKLSEELFLVTCRVVISAPETEIENVRTELARLVAEFSHGTNYNQLELKPARKQDAALEAFARQQLDTTEHLVLSASELATLVRLPSPMTRAAKLKR